jgi:hypothetical protein
MSNVSPRPSLSERIRAAKRRLEQETELLEDPRAEAGHEELAALAMDELAASSGPGAPGQPLPIPRSYLDALLNL